MTSTANAEEWTVRKVLDWSKSYLRRMGVESARYEAETLLAHALGRPRLEVYLMPNRVLSAPQRRRFRQLLLKRRAGQPLQYLLGEVDFLTHRIKVTEHVLIPRPETEGLVELILHDPQREQFRRVLDLGTGSGAIAVALAAQLPQAQVIATDLSVAALILAHENARLNNVLHRISFVQADWLVGIRGHFDLIVSNPPYVATEAIAGLPREVRCEPRLALDGGPAGTTVMGQIIAGSIACLHANGRLYLEFGAGQAEGVRARLQRAGYATIEICRDLSGHERYAKAVNSQATERVCPSSSKRRK